MLDIDQDDISQDTGVDNLVVFCDMALRMTEQPFAPLQTSYCSMYTQKHEPLNHSDMNALSAIYKEGSLQGDKSVGKDGDMEDFSPFGKEVYNLRMTDSVYTLLILTNQSSSGGIL